MGKAKKGGTGGEGRSAAVREAVRQRRDELFRSDWRNPKEITPLLSRAEDNSFQFLIEWCEEYEEVMSKQRERLSDPTPRMK
jgi:hypothetical protein